MADTPVTRSGGASDEPAATRMVARYKALISDFICGRVSAPDFESKYLQLFKTDTSKAADIEFNVLENLFFAIDDYVADPELRERVCGLDDDELRASAEDAYSRLYDRPVQHN
jgi:hypothetical protein